jgi:dCTP deaminase
MVLSDSKLFELLNKQYKDTNYGNVSLNKNYINPSSIDICLGDTVKEPMWYWYNPILRFIMYKLGNIHYFDKSKRFNRYVIHPGRFALFHSMEYINVPIDKCACIFMKSTLGRLGIEHNHSAWIDSGFSGQLTLELINEAPFPVELKVGDRIAQLVFLEMSGTVLKSYKNTGHYQYQTGAMPGIGLSSENYDAPSNL